jgi:hypothetical protein
MGVLRNDKIELLNLFYKTVCCWKLGASRPFTGNINAVTHRSGVYVLRSDIFYCNYILPLKELH